MLKLTGILKHSWLVTLLCNTNLYCGPTLSMTLMKVGHITIIWIGLYYVCPNEQLLEVTITLRSPETYHIVFGTVILAFKF